MKKTNKYLILLAIVLVVIFGVCLMFYPWFAAWYSDQTRAEIQTQYQEIISDSDTSAIDAAKEAAVEYNHKLFSGLIDPLTPEENGYFDQLDPLGTGIIGYIRIDSINVNLPIYHGTDDTVLSQGAGHMPQTSLPIGGFNTHSVISAHNGMASSPMFTDLELLQPGDTFQLEVLGEVLTYEIQSEDDIQTVLPSVIDGIQIKRDEDLCTLITCVPFGINTHRLMVTGHRIPTLEDTEEVASTQSSAPAEDSPTSIWESQYKQSLAIGLSLASVALLVFLFPLGFKNKRGKYEKKKTK